MRSTQAVVIVFLVLALAWMTVMVITAMQVAEQTATCADIERLTGDSCWEPQ